ncbi:PREDICTED: cytochrome P450 6B6-like [Papilio polytes]|uniref:cytochrome P450 6B6-like n=1 Tax=Papilio polytes TaxID=76194 RepID=UPI000675DA54|nr:PREDICTED: cytochrome P450 6B6-like [Papilio polytes]
MFPLLIIIFIVVVYIYTTRNYNYWSKRNIKHDPPIPLFGNHFRNVFGVKSITELSTELYTKYDKEKVVGYYCGSTPLLIVRDLDIARNIMTMDFVYFYPRGLGRDPKYEPLLNNLFHSDGDTWKLLRQRLTPAFTTAKLKKMFPLVVKCAEKMQTVADGIAARGGECDVRELMARFTTEFIGACGFGIEMDTINTEHSLFRELGKKIFTRSWRHILLVAVWDVVPELRRLLRVEDHTVENNLTEIVQKVREHRNYKPSERNDFIDLLLELESKGKIIGESIEKSNPDGSPVLVDMEMDIKCIVAQVFVFFAAGFETSSSATSYCLHELAFHPKIQEKVQLEIDEKLKQYDNKLCYDAIAEMSYLHMAFKESLRKFPSLGVLNRTCARRYKIPELDITIDPGVKIVIPIQAIQMDEKYFDNPNEFRPERFSPEEEKKLNQYMYSPFGRGPRACIGTRLGEMQSLAGLAALLHKFTVEPSQHTQRDLKVNHWSNIVQGVIGGIPLKLTPRKILNME